jgi:hypothetical protein
MNRSARLSTVLVFTAALLASLASAAPPAARERRMHFDVRGAQGQPLYSMTLTMDVNDDRRVERLLVEDAGGARWQIVNRRDYVAQTDEYEFRDGGGRVQSAVAFKLPFKARGARATQQELKTNPGVLRGEVPITVRNARGAAFSFRDSELAGGRAEAVRRGIRGVTDEALIRRLSSARGVFSYPYLSDFCTPLSVMTGEACTRDTSLRIAIALPDCSFDAKFGLPCSAQQSASIRDAVKSRRAIGW